MTEQSDSQRYFAPPEVMLEISRQLMAVAMSVRARVSLAYAYKQYAKDATPAPIFFEFADQFLRQVVFPEFNGKKPTEQ
jgi:hypothetical protein